jgi:magnesium-transporting ATPase (P-type)
LQVNDHYQEDELHHILDPSNKSKYLPKPPVNCCIGMVLTTGFETSKGKLIRKVIANA